MVNLGQEEMDFKSGASMEGWYLANEVTWKVKIRIGGREGQRGTGGSKGLPEVCGSQG